ncbi:hypothetical protein COV06_02550 [Candidatus Uhrbacteria bacterium CG10_big_fil_rev_8_21_14_0_10_50_16]|uniref:Peptidase M50 domain-containing protein n=1 Tax=Candidatus Uhrbacteria bacterium CG10_big_fil_rev_8_21_14_0_10_50_16 TaxID=1975039 RepID=A0A2H0RM51_9BACT|nr:MAG: hypothetical protein COV06_02550 [Candidatus Uhrbacteria bacterium CG10_big_fil_rev_8_21_14_0_10_50_16]
MLNLLFDQPALFLVVLLAIVSALSFHEFAHAFIGYTLGDTTAQRLGRLTLNPLAHIDWLGLLMLVTVGFGWGKPVPFNPHNLKFKTWGPVFVAFAGPASNLLFALVSTALFWVFAYSGLLSADNALMMFFGFSVVINLALMFFNLIPLPPLDGSKLLLLVLDKPKYVQARFWIETRGFWILIGVLVVDSFTGINAFGWLFNLVSRVANLLLGGALL